MSRQYSYPNTVKSGRPLSRSAQKARLQRRLIAISAVILISLIILLGSGIRAFASSGNTSVPQYKYYTSIRVSKGDTLWKIADSYISDYDIDKNDYVAEVCRLNHLTDGQIHSGDYIIVPYYLSVRQ